MAHYHVDLARVRALLPLLKAGDSVSLSGVAYTSRDAAHKRIAALMDEGLPLPYDLRDAAIYYAGPTPAKPGDAIGSCGPTTSGRMDGFAPRFIRAGLVAMIGKGNRSDEVIKAMVECGAVYFAAIGGAGALASKTIVSAEEIAFSDLGCESVKRLVFKDFPAVVAIDASGGSIFKRG